jgi:alanine dehydrogenase
LQALRISDEEIAALMSPADFVDSCHKAFQLYGNGEMLNPARRESITQKDGMDVFHLELLGEWCGKYRGKKVIEERSDVKTGRLGDRTAVISLEDIQTGQGVELDADYITNMRTGAAGVLGAKYLGRLPIRKVAILGTGRIAKALALCADVALQPEVICVTSRKEANRKDFAKDVTDLLSCHLQMTDTIEACVAGADAIFAAVPTPTPILTDEMVGPHTHISVLGGDQRTQQVTQSLFLSRLIVPDHADQVLKSGEFLEATASGSQVCWIKDEAGQIKNVGQVALGALENLRGQGVIVYFSGMAIQDVHAASVVWERYQAHNM